MTTTSKKYLTYDEVCQKAVVIEAMLPTLYVLGAPHAYYGSYDQRARILRVLQSALLFEGWFAVDNMHRTMLRTHIECLDKKYNGGCYAIRDSLDSFFVKVDVLKQEWSRHIQFGQK